MRSRSTLPIQLYMTNGDEPDASEFESVENGHLEVKPFGGLWTSSFIPDGEHDSDWLRWCETEGYFAGRVRWYLWPEEDLDILEVDTLDDLREIVDRYPETEKYTLDIHHSAIDFEAIAADGWDALHLTEEGQWNTRMPGRENPNLYGWDSECTLWFNWCFEEHIYGGVEDEWESPY